MALLLPSKLLQEWIVWNSLALASLPSGLAMLTSGLEPSLLVRLGLVSGLPQLSLAMYKCLVTYTGAVPSEYYRLKKMLDYAKYQHQVNIFMTWSTFRHFCFCAFL